MNEQTVEQLRAELDDARQRVAELEQQYTIMQTLLDHVPMLAMVQSLDGEYQVINQTAAAGFNLTPADMLGKADTDFFPPETIEHFRTLQEQVCETDAPLEAESEAKLEDGVHAYRTIRVPIHNAEDEICAIGTVAVDITVQLENERLVSELAENQAILTGIVDNAPMLILVQDTEGTFLLMSPVAASAFGLEPKDLIGKTDHDIFPQETADAFLKDIRHVAETGETLTREDHTPVGDEMRVYLTNKFPIQNVSGENYAVATVAVDITDLKRSEEERERLQQEVIEAQREALKELSTPIIPVVDRIIVMPLVGSIDSMRARDLMRALLEGISEHRAKIVILDVTGVPMMDTGIVNHINKTIQAARLKGAQTIVTGISDAVAEAIVDLGIDWGAVETLSDLRTGLKIALARLDIELRTE